MTIKERYNNKRKVWGILIPFFRKVHYTSLGTLFLLLSDINIYIVFSIIILYTYITRVAWVVSINKYNVYTIVYKELNKEVI